MSLRSNSFSARAIRRVLKSQPLLLWCCALWLVCAVRLSAQSPARVGDLFASEPGASAEAQLAGPSMSVLSGSELSAGVAPATLKLSRGGQLRICPSSKLSVNAAGQGLMLGINTGDVEVDYRLNQGATDIVLTPDFNIRLAGPAAYHFALGVNSKGDTCIKPLSGNAAGVVFSELLGSDSYGVAPNESAVFAGGKLSGRMSLVEDCGCPAPQPIATDTATYRPAPSGHLGGDSSPANAGANSSGPTEGMQGKHVEVSLPLVFSARASADARPNAVAHIQFSSLPNTFFVQEEPVPIVLLEKPAEGLTKPAEVSTKAASPKADQESGDDAEQGKKPRKGFMSRVKGFFGSIFRR